MEHDERAADRRGGGASGHARICRRAPLHGDRLRGLPYVGRQAPTVSRSDPPLKLGWTYRELSALRLPFWASDEFGFVTYFEQPWGLQFGVLTSSQVRMIEQRLGRRLTDDYRFPWYLHLWGWLPFLGLILWTWLWHREANRAEEERWAE